MIELTEEEYYELNHNYEGICLYCGAINGTVEPDARNYECEICGDFEVFGIEELLIEGKLDIC